MKCSECEKMGRVWFVKYGDQTSRPLCQAHAGRLQGRVAKWGIIAVVLPALEPDPAFPSSIAEYS